MPTANDRLTCSEELLRELRVTCSSCTAECTEEPFGLAFACERYQGPFPARVWVVQSSRAGATGLPTITTPASSPPIHAPTENRCPRTGAWRASKAMGCWRAVSYTRSEVVDRVRWEIRVVATGHRGTPRP